MYSPPGQVNKKKRGKWNPLTDKMFSNVYENENTFNVFGCNTLGRKCFRLRLNTKYI